LPEASTVEGWAAQAPPGFVYAAKLGAFGSHRMKLRDAASWLPNHLDRVRRLGPSLGPTLVQLPPRWKRNVERLDEFLAVAALAGLRWAVELREPSWLHDDVYETLRRHGAALCIHDLLADHPWELTADWTYVRFHGPDALNRKYWGLYGREGLRSRPRHWPAGSEPAMTCTPISTTITKGTPSPTPPGSGTSWPATERCRRRGPGRAAAA